MTTECLLSKRNCTFLSVMFHWLSARHLTNWYSILFYFSFGFIETLSHEKEIFFHFSNFDGKSEKLEVGTEVEYCVFNREKGGKVSAEGVKVLRAKVLFKVERFILNNCDVRTEWFFQYLTKWNGTISTWVFNLEPFKSTLVDCMVSFVKGFNLAQSSFFYEFCMEKWMKWSHEIFIMCNVLVQLRSDFCSWIICKAFDVKYNKFNLANE